MTINKDELRRMAEAATPGPWVADGEGCERYVSREEFDDIAVISVMAYDWSKEKLRFTDGEQTKANQDYIAAANPAAILSLLDELEAKAKTLRDLKWRIEDISAQLTARRGGDGESFYGLDEWSVPIRNLACAVDVINAAMQEQKP